MTTLEAIRASWDRAAGEDAMFNIITDPSKSNHGWTAEEFYAHGQREIDTAVQRLKDLNLIDASGAGQTGTRALDFGCGIGRLSRALTKWFQLVQGVDVSPAMIARANANNQPRRWPILYYVNEKSDLSLFPDDRFDFVYSMVTLQHMPQNFQRGYVAEFFRVLKPGGVAMFQLPEGPDSGSEGWHLSMYGADRRSVVTWIVEASGMLVDVEDMGVDASWRNLRYTAMA